MLSTGSWDILGGSGAKPDKGCKNYVVLRPIIQVQCEEFRAQLDSPAVGKAAKVAGTG